MNQVVKTTIRKTIGIMPKAVKKMLTQQKVNSILAHLMTVEDLKLCLADTSKKDQIIQRCADRDQKAAGKINRDIDTALSNNLFFGNLGEDNKKRIKQDMLFCWYGYGFPIKEYIMYHMWDMNTSHEARHNFLSDKELYAFRFCANDFTNPIYSDKASAYSFLKKYYKRELVLVDGKKDKGAFLAFASGKNTVVKKPLGFSHGDGVGLIRMNDPTPESRIKYFESIQDTGKLLFEEVIEQHEGMKVFNPDSLNTIRVYTLNTRNGIVVLTSMIRTGRQGSFVDNVSSGGICAIIDVNTGTIITDAIDYSGNRYPSHPDTHIQFKGVKIPQWEELLEICREAAALTPDLRFLGWDMAYSKTKGWVLVEVNTAPGLIPPQALTVSGFRSDLIRISRDMDLLIPFRFREL